jgi:hypothetical protein
MPSILRSGLEIISGIFTTPAALVLWPRTCLCRQTGYTDYTDNLCNPVQSVTRNKSVAKIIL